MSTILDRGRGGDPSPPSTLAGSRDDDDREQPAIVAAFAASVGVISRSSWMTIDQASVDAFATITRDHNPLHREGAAAVTGPFGAPVAHGFLMLSLLSSFVNEMTGIPVGAKAAVNRGFNRVRFLAPVWVGSRVRGRMTTRAVRAVDASRLMVRVSVTVEVEGTAQPALAADWEFIVYV